MGEYWPAVVFRGASASLRDQILSYLESADDSQSGTLPVNHALCALAWIGDDAVANAFARWVNTPPRWRETLHVGPAEYARVAGWELKETLRRNLYFGTCSTVRATDAPASGAVAFQQQQQTCPWCARPLVSMLSLGSEATPVPLGTRHLVILTCGQCTFYAEYIFAHVSEDGGATLHPKNQRPSILPDNSVEAVYPRAGVSIELAPRSTIIAHEYSLADHTSQIGGIPAWVQDTAYPKCPDCGETMMFFAQLDNSAFRNYEGVYYAFVCVKCRNTATCLPADIAGARRPSRNEFHCFQRDLHANQNLQKDFAPCIQHSDA